jgi:hypothetical protein
MSSDQADGKPTLCIWSYLEVLDEPSSVQKSIQDNRTAF